MVSRPAIPKELERELKLEVGHRCAIPTCRQTPVELAHIEPWSKVQEHRFANVIVLCPNCHTRFDRGDIDRISMLHYKSNLVLINSRYGDLERRVLEAFLDNPDAEEISLPGNFNILMKYLFDDDVVVLQPVKASVVVKMKGEEIPLVPPLIYRLTANGKEFIEGLKNARELE